MSAERRIIMYVNADMDADDVERWAAHYGYIVANPLKQGDGVTIVHQNGVRIVPPPGLDIWISDLIASEHDQESA